MPKTPKYKAELALLTKQLQSVQETLDRMISTLTDDIDHGQFDDLRNYIAAFLIDETD